MSIERSAAQCKQTNCGRGAEPHGIRAQQCSPGSLFCLTRILLCGAEEWAGGEEVGHISHSFFSSPLFAHGMCDSVDNGCYTTSLFYYITTYPRLYYCTMIHVITNLKYKA